MIQDSNWACEALPEIGLPIRLYLNLGCLLLNILCVQGLPKKRIEEDWLALDPVLGRVVNGGSGGERGISIRHSSHFLLPPNFLEIESFGEAFPVLPAIQI